MKKVYAVMVDMVDRRDTDSNIVGRKVYMKRKAARQAMIADFNTEKARLDEMDDFDEAQELDFCALSANNEWSRRWYVMELSIGEEVAA